MADVAADELHARLQPRAPDAPARARQHRRRPIDADERHAGAAERQRDAAGAAAELEHRPAGLQRQVAPERHVAPAERARVLPVVERRVLVPAFVTFGSTPGPSVSSADATQIAGPRWQTASCSGFRRTPAPACSRLRRVGVEHVEILAARASCTSSVGACAIALLDARPALGPDLVGRRAELDLRHGKQPDVERLDAVRGEERRQLRADRGSVASPRAAATRGEELRRDLRTPAAPTASSCRSSARRCRARPRRRGRRARSRARTRARPRRRRRCAAARRRSTSSRTTPSWNGSRHASPAANPTRMLCAGRRLARGDHLARPRGRCRPAGSARCAAGRC